MQGGYPPGWYPYAPPRVPGEGYRKALGIITIVATSLLLLGGLLLLGITALLSVAGEGEDLSAVSLLVMLILASLAGGGAGLYHAIRSLMRRPSAPFSLPNFWVLLALTVVILGTGIALFATNQPTGSMELIILLVLLSSIVPYLAVLALGLQRLGTTVTWRHIVLAWTNGATLAVLLGSLLELLLTLALLGAAGSSVDLSGLNSNNFGTVAALILVAVIAPVVEETTKQISGFFLLPRIKKPQEAFLIGLAAGIGFAIVESAGYIGSAQADWVGIAFGRVGAGLLHGMGAAMAGLGWYYAFKGKGAPRRALLAVGFLAYAYLQHAIFNGGQVLLAMLFPSLGNWHFDLFALRIDASFLYAGTLYLIIVAIMLLVMRWLRQSAPLGGGKADAARPAPSVSLASYSSRQPATPMNGPAPNATPHTAQGVGEPGSRELGGAV
jgi:RsiW-degrading membrane proteinase PrsW (M82 family)